MKILDEDGKIIKKEPLRCLDIAGGIGDISFKILDKAWQDSPDCKYFIIINFNIFLELSARI